jgi:NADH-quinone oxidoreductase subunit G
LNYKWINRETGLKDVHARGRNAGEPWDGAQRNLRTSSRKLRPGSVAIVASARQTNEELYLLANWPGKLGAITDSVRAWGKATSCCSARIESEQQRRAAYRHCFSEMGIELPKIADGIAKGAIKTLIVFGEDVTKHGIGADLLDKLETLVVSDILPNATTARRITFCPGCAHARSAARSRMAKGACRSS